MIELCPELKLHGGQKIVFTLKEAVNKNFDGSWSPDPIPSFCTLAPWMNSTGKGADAIKYKYVDTNNELGYMNPL